MIAPFPYFGGKRSITDMVWQRFGRPKQYIEPFCGSAAMLLAAPAAASLEVVCDMNGFIANFWRAVKHQPDKVAEWADYPVSHIDLGARHGWLMGQREHLAVALHDPDWSGDAKVAGWWLHGQCCWIGSGWCDWSRQRGDGRAGGGEASSPGQGITGLGQIPHASDAGRGYDRLLTSCGRTAWVWLHQIADRLERVRVVHGSWERCLNHHYGANDTAVFLDPPYRAYEALYGASTPVADEVEAWARDNPKLRIALCGHVGDYDLPGWDAVQWDRGRPTYGGSKTTDAECVWFSPGSLPRVSNDLFACLDPADGWVGRVWAGVEP